MNGKNSGSSPKKNLYLRWYELVGMNSTTWSRAKLKDIGSKVFIEILITIIFSIGGIIMSFYRKPISENLLVVLLCAGLVINTIITIAVARWGLIQKRDCDDTKQALINEKESGVTVLEQVFAQKTKEIQTL